MRAIQYTSYGSRDVLDIVDVDVPRISSDEVLIRVQAASLNPFDWKLRSGMLSDLIQADFPTTPGRDGCGEIVEVGRNARDLQLAKGQRVSFISGSLQHGTMAEYVAAAARDNVVPAAENLTVQESAAIPLIGLSAWNALVDTAEIRAGMRVLIHGGSGGVGSIAIQIARHFGADIYATCHSSNLEMVETLGAHAIPYDTVDLIDAVSDCDVVFDTVGGAVHEDSYQVLKKGGRLVYLLAMPFNDMSADYGIEDLQARVLGHTANLANVIDFAKQGIIKPIIGQALDFSDFKKAFERGESGKTGGKIVLTFES